MWFQEMEYILIEHSYVQLSNTLLIFLSQAYKSSTVMKANVIYNFLNIFKHIIFI